MKQIILYVDDEYANLFLFKLFLEKDYNIIICESGKEGLDILKINKDISIVFSDMKMPHMDGIEFIKTARMKYPHIKYFILSAFDISDITQKALNDGTIQEYLTKPFNMDVIKKNINKYLY